FDFVRFIENSIRQRFLLTDSGNSGDHVIEALEMLHIERRPDADAGVQQFLDVLPALGMARKWLALGDIGMRQLVDEDRGGSAFQRGVEIEFASRDSPVAD